MKRRLKTKKVGGAIHPPPKGGGLLALIIKFSFLPMSGFEFSSSMLVNICITKKFMLGQYCNVKVSVK